VDTGIIAPPAAQSLEAWSRLSWRDGVQLESTTRLDTLQVRTRNTTYEIVVISPHSGEVIVRGGQFFPQHTRAVVAGSSLGGSVLKLRGIYVGFSLEILHEGTPIVTTRVRAIAPGNAMTVQ
jgi:hypothetical protein